MYPILLIHVHVHHLTCTFEHASGKLYTCLARGKHSAISEAPAKFATYIFHNVQPWAGMRNKKLNWHGVRSNGVYNGNSIRASLGTVLTHVHVPYSRFVLFGQRFVFLLSNLLKGKLNAQSQGIREDVIGIEDVRTKIIWTMSNFLLKYEILATQKKPTIYMV